MIPKLVTFRHKTVAESACAGNYFLRLLILTPYEKLAVICLVVIGLALVKRISVKSTHDTRFPGNYVRSFLYIPPKIRIFPRRALRVSAGHPVPDAHVDGRGVWCSTLSERQARAVR